MNKKLLLIKSCRIDQFEHCLTQIKDQHESYDRTVLVRETEFKEFKEKFNNLNAQIYKGSSLYFFDLVSYVFKERFSKIIFFYNDFNHKTYYKIEFALIFSFLSKIRYYDVDNTYKEYNYFEWILFYCILNKIFILFQSIICFIFVNLLLLSSRNNRNM